MPHALLGSCQLGSNVAPSTNRVQHMLHAQLCSSYDAACARQQPAETSGRMFHSMALSSRRAVRVQAQSDQHVNLQPAESRRHAIGAISTSIASTVGLAQGLPAWASAVQNGTSVDNAGAEVEQPKKRRLDRTRLVPISSVALARNLRVSQIIKGCWQLDGRHVGEPMTDRTSGEDAVVDLDKFYRAGMTTVDTADVYGQSEALLGQYLRLYPQRRGGLTISTKLTFAGKDMAMASKDMVQYKVRGALVRLGVERIDLLSLQWEDLTLSARWLDVLKCMVELQQAGLIKQIGVCNFDVPSLIKALDAGIPILTNQVQYSLLDRRPALYMQQLCARRGVKMLAYGTLAGGFLSHKYLGMPAGRARLDTVGKVKYGRIITQYGGWTLLQDLLRACEEVAERHGASPSAVAMRYVLQQPGVAALLVGARNGLHVRDVQTLQLFELNDDDMLDLDAAWESAVQPTTDVYIWERGGLW